MIMEDSEGRRGKASKSRAHHKMSTPNELNRQKKNDHEKAKKRLEEKMQQRHHDREQQQERERRQTEHDNYLKDRLQQLETRKQEISQIEEARKENRKALMQQFSLDSTAVKMASVFMTQIDSQMDDTTKTASKALENTLIRTKETS